MLHGAAKGANTQVKNTRGCSRLHSGEGKTSGLSRKNSWDPYSCSSGSGASSLVDSTSELVSQSGVNNKEVGTGCVMAPCSTAFAWHSLTKKRIKEDTDRRRRLRRRPRCTIDTGFTTYFYLTIRDGPSVARDMIASLTVAFSTSVNGLQELIRTSYVYKV